MKSRGLQTLIRITLFAVFVAALPLGCSDAGDLLDLATDPPSRKPIDISTTGVNNFFVNDEFGSIPAQYSEIKNTLGLRYVRVLFAWTDGVQAQPDSEPNYSFYDNILRSIPPGVDVLIVLAHQPNWMANPGNWVNNNPRLTWVERWLRPTVRRYSNTPGIVGWEVWNEPDLTVVPADAALGLTLPENYFQMLQYASRAIREEDPRRLVVSAATQSIQQNFPTNLNYNKSLRDLGADGLVDVWNVHYYGTSYESVITSNGVADFLNSLGKTIWVTESGEQGPNNQLPYVETAWPFLKEEIPAIGRFYYYEFGSTQPLQNNYGLRTIDPAFPVSDLYIYLRDHAG